MSVPIRRVLQAGAVILLAALIGLFAKSVIDNQTSIAADVADGGHPMAPDFTLQNVNGHGTTTLSSLRGKPVVLNFWASWCDPCKTEAPALQELSQKYAGRMTVVGLDSQDDTGDARDFARRYHLTYPLVHAGGSSIYHRWGLSGFPETFIIDSRGRVIHHFPGEVSAADVEQQLKPLLGNA
ncbi:MAG TPA: TlpA disulfide reductase family protein [Gaiellales bacterium]|nr:TlpA disulfide reductase family protein [Gaiellales bacterium]